MAKTYFPDKDPRDVADYSMLWREAEADAETERDADPIVSAQVTILGDADDLIVEDTQVLGSATISRISGGVAGSNYQVQGEVVLTSGRRFNRVIHLKVRDL